MNRRAAELAAYEVLEETGQRRPPIDVESIARDLNLYVVYERLEGDVSGTLFHDDDGDVILGVNTFHHWKRQRFTVAHEIGHYWLHVRDRSRSKSEVFVDRPAEVLFRDRTASKGLEKKEIEANAFAAALLMPENLVDAEARKLFARDRRLNDDELVELLAGRFDVSEQAMRYRLVNLHIVDPV